MESYSKVFGGTCKMGSMVKISLGNTAVVLSLRESQCTVEQ